MSVVMHEDKREKRLSIMNQQSTKCDGQQDGFECEHFLRFTQKIDTPAAISLAKGETSRWCTVTSWAGEPLDLGDAGKDMAVACNRYQPSQRKFDEENAADNYNPPSQAVVEELRKGKDPGKDEHFPPVPFTPPEDEESAPDLADNEPTEESDSPAQAVSDPEDDGAR